MVVICSIGRELTLQRRETTVHDQLEIAQLALGEDDGREGLGLDGELVVAGSIAGNQVLEDTTVRNVGHDVIWRNEKEGGIGKWRKDQNEKGLLDLARGILYNGKKKQKRWDEKRGRGRGRGKVEARSGTRLEIQLKKKNTGQPRPESGTLSTTAPERLPRIPPPLLLRVRSMTTVCT
jgi:hypothetical protein